MTQWNFWDQPDLAQSNGTTSAVKTTVKSKMPQLLSGLFILVKDVVGSVVGPNNAIASIQVPDPKEVTFV